MSVTPAQIKKVILDEDSLGHELQVGHILKNAVPQTNQRWIGHTEHGGTYTDQITQKTRQFDYRSRIIDTDDKTIALSLECKKLNPDFPLVVCGRQRNAGESYHVFIERVENNQNGQAKRVQGNQSIYKPGGFVGKSLLRLVDKNGKLSAGPDSEVYDKWAQALASAYDLGYFAIHQRTKPRQSTFILPVVIVPDGSLFIAHYEENGAFSCDPKQADRCEYFVAHDLKLGLWVFLSHIHFVTCTGLASMLSDFLKDRLPFAEIFNKNSVII